MKLNLTISVCHKYVYLNKKQLKFERLADSGNELYNVASNAAY
jgi:hypothetical protein